MMILCRLPLFALAGAVLAANGCKGDKPSAPLFRGTTIAILDAPEDGVLLHERALRLRASVRDADGVDLPDVPVGWRVSDEHVASVTDDGVVTALRLGEVEVRATGGGATDILPFSVRIGVPVPGPDDDDPVTSELLEGLLRVTVPEDAMPAGAVLHVRPAANVPSNERLLPGTAVELGPSSLRFDRSVTIAIAYPDDVPAGQRSRLRLYRVDDDGWAAVASFVDPVDERVRAGITRAGIYAIHLRPPPTDLAVLSGDGQQAGVGAPVPIAPRVVAREGEEPAEGAVIRFSVASGGGRIVGPDSGISDASGVAVLPGEWYLGPAAGANSLRAAPDGATTPVVTFTATASAIALPVIVVSHPEVNFDATVGTSPPPREVLVASSSGIPVIGLSVGTVRYELGGSTGWLQATLDRSLTPAVLRLAPSTVALPANDYVAFVPLRSSVPGIDPETVTVRLGVRHGATSSALVSRQLAGAVSGRVATTQPRIEFRSASGALSPVSDLVTAVLVGGLGTLRGTTTVAAVSGVATFADLRIDGYGVHRLRFSGGGVSVDGSTFNVSQLLASLEIVDQPSETEEDKVFPVVPRIRLLDDAGLSYQPSKTVIASIASGSGELEGNESVSATDGFARFPGLRIEDGTGLHTLRFRTTNPTLSVISAAFTVRP